MRNFLSLGTLKAYVDNALWVLLFVLAPYTVLIIASQNTVPGDLLYPFKRGMEGMVLMAASVHPTTKAFFRADLANRRFDEAEKLLLAKLDPTALDGFVSEVYETQQAVEKLSDYEKKEELAQKLIAQIDQYQTRLSQVQAKVQPGTYTSKVAQQTPPQSTKDTIARIPPQSPQSNLQQTNEQKQKSEESSSPISQDTQSRTQTAPTPTPLPPPPTPLPNPIIDDINRVQDELDKIKDLLQAQNPTPSLSPLQLHQEVEVTPFPEPTPDGDDIISPTPSTEKEKHDNSGRGSEVRNDDHGNNSNNSGQQSQGKDR